MPINSIDLVTLPSRSAEASTIAGREQHQIQHMADSGATILEIPDTAKIERKNARKKRRRKKIKRCREAALI